MSCTSDCTVETKSGNVAVLRCSGVVPAHNGCRLNNNNFEQFHYTIDRNPIAAWGLYATAPIADRLESGINGLRQVDAEGARDAKSAAMNGSTEFKMPSAVYRRVLAYRAAAA
jgi:hypothetical protein